MCLVIAVPMAQVCVIRALGPAVAAWAEPRGRCGGSHDSLMKACWRLNVCSPICNLQVCLLAVCRGLPCNQRVVFSLIWRDSPGWSAPCFLSAPDFGCQSGHTFCAGEQRHFLGLSQAGDTSLSLPQPCQKPHS